MDRAHLVLLRRSGPAYDPSLPVEEQTGWAEHADHMDLLVAQGVVLLGGPLADEQRVALVVRAPSEAEVRRHLAADPWSGTHLVVEQVAAWTLRLGRLGD